MVPLRTQQTFFLFFVPDITPHYHPHLFRRTDILTDSRAATSEIVAVLLHIHIIYGRYYIFGNLAGYCNVAC